MISVSFHRFFVFNLIITVAWFMWKDVQLYHELQNTRILYKPKDGQTSSTGLSVKFIMMDPANCYIFNPMAEELDTMIGLTEGIPFISANMLSFFGVLAAIVSARLLIVTDSLWYHRLAIVFFEIRTFFDALDGIIARNRMGIKIHLSLVNSSGYFVDAVADTIGFSLVILASYFFMHKTRTKRRISVSQYTLIMDQENQARSLTFYASELRKIVSIIVSNESLFIILCFWAQLAQTSLFWNRYIDAYHRILETPAASPGQARRQTEILHSPATWAIMWIWRMSCGHSMMQMLSISIFFNKIYEFLDWLKYIGFLELLLISLITEIHLSFIEYYVN